MSSSKKKNVLFLLIDGCEYSVFQNIDEARELAPTLTGVIDKGFVRKMISNGMITQVSLPTILTQTYPLDFGGYNFGIKNRPKSIIELLKENKYSTYFIAAHDITGPRRNFERGADVVRAIYDNDDIVEDYIRLILYHEFDLLIKGEITEEQFIHKLQTEFHDILSYAEWSGDRFERVFSPRRLRVPSAKTSLLLRCEREILKRDPYAIMDKLKKVPSSHYQDFLGEDLKDIDSKQIKKIIDRRNQITAIKLSINFWFKRITGAGLSLFPTYLSPVAREVVDEALDVLKMKDSPWFMFIQLMDHHDGAKSSRYINFINKIRYIPRLLRIRKKHATHREFWRDLSLIYLDTQFKRFMKCLENEGVKDDTLIIAFGDHGMGWDMGRGTAQMANLGLRTHHEHIEVPLIVSPTNKIPCDEGVHDGMSISATLLDELGIEPHPSFLGRSVYEKGKAIAIVESVGRGNCDLKYRDLYFTLQSKTHKLMVILKNKKVFPKRLYDKLNDPYEYNNLIDSKEIKPIINELLRELVNEREEILLARGVNITGLKENVEDWTTYSEGEEMEVNYETPRSYKEIKSLIQ